MLVKTFKKSNEVKNLLNKLQNGLNNVSKYKVDTKRQLRLSSIVLTPNTFTKLIENKTIASTSDTEQSINCVSDDDQNISTNKIERILKVLDSYEIKELLDIFEE